MQIPPPLLIGVQKPYLMMSAEWLVTRLMWIHVVEVQALSRRILQVALVLMLGIAVVQLVKLAPVPQVTILVAK